MTQAPNTPQTETAPIFNVPIRRLATRLQTLVQRGALRPHGVKIQEWRILWSLAREGDTHLRELGRRASVDAAHVSRLIRTLEKQNLIARKPDPNDARRTLFSITPTGFDLYVRVRPKAVAVSDEFRAIYTAKEYETLMTLIERANRHADMLLHQQETAQDRTAPAAAVEP